jgi:hypothetical protein
MSTIQQQQHSQHNVSCNEISTLHIQHASTIYVLRNMSAQNAFAIAHE